ncbi:MAG: hypothetical protein ACI9WU_004781, partial [Myxococcota bacterium]
MKIGSLLCTVALLLSGCGKKAAETPAPALQAKTNGDAPASIEPAKPAPPPEPPAPRTPLRVLIPAPDWLLSTETAALTEVRATLSTKEQVLTGEAPVKNLASARLGVAVLLLTVGKSPDPPAISAARRLLDTLGAADRVAIGAVTDKGFSLVNDFTADTRSAASALRHLGASAPPASEAPGPQLYEGLHGALDAFRNRSVSPLRAIVIASDGSDPTLRRTSQFARVEAAIRRRAAYHGVRFYAIGLGDDQTGL